MNHPTLRQRLDERTSHPERPAGLGWNEFFQWLGQQTAAPERRGPRAKLIRE